MAKELEWRAETFGAWPIDTIYLGGGTPSILEINELNVLFDLIYSKFKVNPQAEVTLEANPDDLSQHYLKSLRQTPVNRLSIGIQSFSDADLQFMNRAHHAKEARECIESALKEGFDNLTVDLIYGSPTTDDPQWLTNLQTIFEYKIPHISCYCLTVEPRTALDHMVRKGKAAPVDEDQAARQFELLMEAMASQGYEHYEISNFALPGHYSRHKTSYWLGESYLGLGPAAHSFDGKRRWWNLANNALYIKALEAEIHPAALYEEEILTSAQQYNEYVMTSLRTIWGCKLEQIETIGAPFVSYFIDNATPFVKDGSLLQQGNSFFLTRSGRLIADHIAATLFYIQG